MQAALSIPRPGVRLGPYPEQLSQRAPWPSYFMELLRARLLAARTPSSREKTRFLKAVHNERVILGNCDLESIMTKARGLRSRLVVNGMQPDVVAEAFALIDVSIRLHLGMSLHDSQFLAGWLMLDRRLIEMQTGEGKTLAVALAAATGALAGIPVHVVTANDYLVERDAMSLQAVFQTLGLSVATVTAATEQTERPYRYRCDITYCTAKELAFDYLRDRLADGSENAMPAFNAGRRLRGLCMAIIDEADSVLIDEARMPLILSDSVEDTEQSALYRQALFLAAQLKAEEHYQLDHEQRRAILTAAGQAHAQTLGEQIGGAWNVRRHREETLCLALAALHLFIKEQHYLVRDKQVVIIDETTGRVASGRVWSRGLHQLIETKERCALTAQQHTVAQTTFQRFFSRYLHVSGISGTLSEAHGQLLAIYGLPVARIPLQFRCRRKMLAGHVFATQEAQWRYVVNRVQALRAFARPVLIGTDSVSASEALSVQLALASVPHTVLNARFDAEEASIVARAGQAGAVTVSTNMAGRGTDIRLGAGVADIGGMHVIACQVNDSRRIDRQLYGRCARQGEPGSVEHLYVLDKGFMPLQGAAEWMSRLMRVSGTGGELSRRFLLLARLAQRLRERYRCREQWYLYLHEWQLERQFVFAGDKE